MSPPASGGLPRKSRFAPETQGGVAPGSPSYERERKVQRQDGDQPAAGSPREGITTTHPASASSTPTDVGEALDTDKNRPSLILSLKVDPKKRPSITTLPSPLSSTSAQQGNPHKRLSITTLPSPLSSTSAQPATDLYAGSGSDSPHPFTPIADVAASVVSEPSPTAASMVDVAASSHASQLAGTLLSFTSLASAIASTSAQRELAEKSYKQREKELQTNSRYYNGFQALLEQKQNAKVQAEKSYKALDRKWNEHMDAQKALTQAIALNICSIASTSQVSADATEKQNQTDAEVKILRAEVERLNELLSELKSARNERIIPKVQEEQVKAMNRGIANLEKRVTAAEKLNGVNKQFDDVWEAIDACKSRLASLEKTTLTKTDLRKSADDVAARSRQLSADSAEQVAQRAAKKVWEGFGTLIAEAKKSAEDATTLSNTVKLEQDGLKTRLGELQATTDGLNTIVNGKESEDGLAVLPHLAAEFGKKMDKTISALKALEKNYNDSVEDNNDVLNRLDKLEAREAAANMTDKTAKSDLLCTGAPDATAFLKMQKQLHEVVKDLDDIRSDQDRKDELVALENDNIMQACETKHVETRGTLSRVVADVNTLRLTMSSVQTQVQQQQTITAEQTAKNTLTGHDLDFIRVRLTEYAKALSALPHIMQRIDVLATAAQSLEGRFSNLTTDELAKNMVHQMQQLYPDVSKCQAELERLWTVEKEFRELSSVVKELTANVVVCGQMAEHTIQLVKDNSSKLDSLERNLQPHAEQLGSGSQSDGPSNSEGGGALASPKKDTEKQLSLELTHVKGEVEEMNRSMSSIKTEVDSHTSQLAEHLHQIAAVQSTAGVLFKKVGLGSPIWEDD